MPKVMPNETDTLVTRRDQFQPPIIPGAQFHPQPSPVSFQCPVCANNYGKEKTRDRHIAYCRRRQNVPIPPRRISCSSCISLKIRCDRKRPICSTCVTKRKNCQYLESGTSSSQSSGSPQPSSKKRDCQSGGVDTSQVALYERASEKSTDLALRDSSYGSEIHVPSNVFWSNTFQTTIPQIFNPSCLALSSTEIWSYAPLSSTQTRSQLSSPNLSWLTESNIWPWNADISLPEYWPSPASSTIEWKPPRTLTPKPLPSIVGTANGRFTLQTLRTYPKMMLKKNTWPPIINIHCQYDIAHVESENIIGNCVNIVQMFYSRTKENADLVWRAVRFEIEKFGQLFMTYSKESLLATAQSISLFLLLRLIEGPTEYNNFELELLLILSKVFFEGIWKIQPTYIDILSRKAGVPSWADWLWAESLDRIATLYYILGLFTTSDQTCQSFASVARDTYMPCKRALWESPDSMAWKQEYDLGGSGEMTILMMFDLHRSMKMDVNGGVSDVLDRWYADVDGLGGLVLLSAAVGWMKDDGELRVAE